jgi:DedD protein
MPPAKPERPLTLPAKPQIATMKPTGPVMILPPLVSKEAARPPVPAIAKAHEAAPAAPAASAKPAEAPAVKPLAQAIEAARHFLVQVGVFSSVANAEELRAKLELAGVPAQIEARVQVGPFASRQEAEQARAKLKELGIEPGMVVAAHNK